MRQAPEHKKKFLPNNIRGPHHRLQAGSGDHELHLLGEHGCCCLLLDEIVAPIYL